MRRLLAFALLALCAGCAAAQQAPDLDALPLVPASTLSERRHVVLTVELSEAALSDAAASAFAAEHDAEVAAIWPLSTIDAACYVLAVPEAADAEAVSAALARDARVLTASPLAAFETNAVRYADDLLPIQHALHRIGAVAAHEVTTGRGVRVALIDSGVATGHADLAAQAITYRDFIRVAPGGVVAERHGTAMAALIAADARNGAGMVGVAPDVEMMALRACWTEAGRARDRCNTFTLARALNFALANEADIVNLSLGGGQDPLIARLLDEALARDVLVVAAHGPDRTPAFPADHPGVLAARAAGTGRGPGLPAPGRDVLSATEDGYDFFSGDSVATAHVTGVAALLLARDRGVRDAGAVAHGLSASVADRGIVNACDALRRLPGELGACPADPRPRPRPRP